MGVFQASNKHQVPRLDLELTPGCDHACGHCYNVWGAEEDDPQGGYPTGQLRTEDYLAMMDKVVGQSGADHITITGGEPLLRKDALTIIEHACELVSTVQVITNGSHVTQDTIDRFKKAGVRAVQLTLLSADRDRHNALKGADCFDDTVRAAYNLVQARVPVQVCFVAMNENWEDFEGVMELCYALGVRAITYNRMSPTGVAIHHVAQLMPAVEQVEHNLDTAERLGRQWKIQVATAMPIPPCLIRLERYPWVQFGFCSTGTDSPNIAIDAKGNVRSCNLSSNIMGNVVDQDWPEIYASTYLHTFKRQVPAMCKGCKYEQSCQGGCKESGFATFGSLSHPEPLLHLAQNPDWRNSAGEAIAQQTTTIPLNKLSIGRHS
jgi:radical SAM protein with 4Fe4S-binding SPASM domain